MKNRFLYLFIFLLALGSSATAATKNLNVQTRAEIAKTLTRIVSREVAGGDVKIEAVKVEKGRLQLYTTIGLSYYPFREDNLQAMYDSVRLLLPRDMQKHRIELYTDRREARTLIPMAFRTTLPTSKKERLVPFVNPSERPLVTPLSSVVAPGALAGRHIALWQSHGRYFDQPQNRWRWQRVRLWETCEDLYTQSYVLPYLVPMLENAGANVLLPRERDVQRHEVLTDNDAQGQYREQNGSEKWSSGGVGFAHNKQVYRTGENPFRDGTTRRVRSTTDDAESQAVWSATIPEKGEYAVYVSYASSPESADDVNYTVHHAGGESRFAVNQTMGGGTWIYLGHFPFAAGAQEVVRLSNRSQKPGRIVSADAVKIGGGYGNITRTIDDPQLLKGREALDETSGYPRFCEGVRYWLQWAGFGEEVYTPKQNKDDYKDDYMSRAHWVNALMGGSRRLPDSVGLRVPIDMAMAFHSDAGVRLGDETIGTLGIFYTRDNNGRFAGGADRYRSRDLTDIVMSQIVSDIRSSFEPEWSRRGLWNRSYYEARVPAVPTMLLELLSHQNFADMRYGHDPRFKFLVSRAIYKGILRYLSSQNGTPYIVQPLPVEAMATRFTPDGGVEISWSPVVDSLEATATPTGYVVYTRRDDGGFDNGRFVEQPQLITEQEPGHIYSYKVTAVNAGGESFPSETLAACRMADERGSVLIVNGFDRVSAPVSSGCDSLAGFYNDLDGGVADKVDIAFIGKQRIFDRSMARSESEACALGACYSDYETDVIGGNTFDYPYLHGRAVAAAGYSFCSTSVKAVEQGAALAQYALVDLILGKQRTTSVGRGVLGPEFQTFTPALQRAIRELQAAGGALFVSGSYIATDLWTGEGMTEADRAFAREVLHIDFEAGQLAERGRVRVVASRADFRRGEYRYHDDFGPDHYIVETADVLKPVGAGAFTVMRYLENNQPSGVASTAQGRTFVMGLPFEAITTDAQRERLMSDILKFLNTKK